MLQVLLITYKCHVCYISHITYKWSIINVTGVQLQNPGRGFERASEAPRRIVVAASWWTALWCAAAAAYLLEHSPDGAHPMQSRRMGVDTRCAARRSYSSPHRRCSSDSSLQSDLVPIPDGYALPWWNALVIVEYEERFQLHIRNWISLLTPLVWTRSDMSCHPASCIHIIYWSLLLVHIIHTHANISHMENKFDSLFFH